MGIVRHIPFVLAVFAWIARHELGAGVSAALLLAAAVAGLALALGQSRGVLTPRIIAASISTAVLTGLGVVLGVVVALIEFIRHGAEVDAVIFVTYPLYAGLVALCLGLALMPSRSVAQTA